MCYSDGETVVFTDIDIKTRLVAAEAKDPLGFAS